MSADRKPSREPARFLSAWLELGDRAVYVMVALLLLGVSFAIVVYSAVTFTMEATDDFLLAVVALINDLLLVLILMELLGTVRSYLSTGITSLRVFLYVGIISAVRRVLAIGAQTTVGEGVSDDIFRNLMLDLAVNAGLILALALSLWLLSLQRRNLPSAAEPQATARAEDESPGWS